MREFIQQHNDSVIGVINGFDRVRFRGTVRLLANTAGLDRFLRHMGVLLKDAGKWMEKQSESITKASLKVADNSGRPVQYINNSYQSKEELARRIADKDRIKEGLVCALTAVEPCNSFDIQRDREQKKLVLVSRLRKCLHVYHYYMHPQWGLMHMRLQTWFPFNLWSCLNGREWLARQLDQHQIGYQKRENCFIAVQDVGRAQELADAQLQTDWSEKLNDIALQINPIHKTIFANFPLEYYWSCQDSEWASDIMFRSPQALSQLYPHLIRHGMQNLSCGHVMRFLGKKSPTVRGLYGRFAGEVVSNVKERHEGIRLKHYVNGNSVKMYNKQGSVLRIETTILQPRDFKVYRGTEKEPENLKWQRMRKGVADLPRRAAVSQASNSRYAVALTSAHCSNPLKDLAKDVCQRKRDASRSVRALNPLETNDAVLLETVNRGEFAINGFRNRDLRKYLYPKATNDKVEQRKRSAAITRKVRILRMHNLIKKVPKTHRYVLTSQGFKIITALLAARCADAEKLIDAA